MLLRGIKPQQTQLPNVIYLIRIYIISNNIYTQRVFPLNSITLRQYTEVILKKINHTLNPISIKLDFYIKFNWYVLDLQI